jgi:hypothetical protein
LTKDEDKNEEQRGKIQKRMAEQLGERVGTSPREIERGVKRLIEDSRKALGGRQLKPPYRRSSWYDDFFDMIKQRTVNNFSIDFINLNIASGSEAYKFRSGLLFLGLIDQEGHPTKNLQKLRVTGEAFCENFGNVIHEAYEDLFQAIIIEKAKPESVINFMIERYGYSRLRAEEATSLFVYFCKTANIAISNELSNFQVTVKEAPHIPISQKTSKERKETAPDMRFDESFITLKSGEFFFAVKKELSAMEMAKSQLNSYLDYHIKRYHDEEKASHDTFESFLGRSSEKKQDKPQSG